MLSRFLKYSGLLTTIAIKNSLILTVFSPCAVEFMWQADSVKL